MKAPSTRIRIFLNPQLFFPCPKIPPSTRIVFKWNSPVHTHPMVSGCTRCAAILVYCSVRDWARFCYVIGSKESGFTVHMLSDSLRIYFFPSGEQIQKFPVGCVRTEALSGKKKLRIQKYSDMCGRGLSVLHRHFENTQERPPFR